jgi:hypothetical protein
MRKIEGDAVKGLLDGITSSLGNKESEFVKALLETLLQHINSTSPQLLVDLQKQLEPISTQYATLSTGLSSNGMVQALSDYESRAKTMGERANSFMVTWDKHKMDEKGIMIRNMTTLINSQATPAFINTLTTSANEINALYSVIQSTRLNPTIQLIGRPELNTLYNIVNNQGYGSLINLFTNPLDKLRSLGYLLNHQSLPSLENILSSEVTPATLQLLENFPANLELALDTGSAQLTTFTNSIPNTINSAIQNSPILDTYLNSIPQRVQKKAEGSLNVATKAIDDRISRLSKLKDDVISDSMVVWRIPLENQLKSEVTTMIPGVVKGETVTVTSAVKDEMLVVIPKALERVEFDISDALKGRIRELAPDTVTGEKDTIVTEIKGGITKWTSRAVSDEKMAIEGEMGTKMGEWAKGVAEAKKSDLEGAILTKMLLLIPNTVKAKEVTDSLTTALNSAAPGVLQEMDFSTQIKAAAKKVALKTISALPEIKSNIETAAKGVVKDVINGLEEIKGEVTRVAKENVGGVVGGLDEINSTIKSEAIKKIKDVVKDLNEVDVEVKRVAKEKLNGVIKGMEELDPEIVKVAKDRLEDLIKGIKEIGTGVTAEAKQQLAGIVEKLEMDGEISRVANKRISGVIGGMKEIETELAKDLEGRLGNVVKGLKGVEEEISKHATTLIIGVVQTLDEATKAAISGRVKEITPDIVEKAARSAAWRTNILTVANRSRPLTTSTSMSEFAVPSVNPNRRLREHSSAGSMEHTRKKTAVPMFGRPRHKSSTTLLTRPNLEASQELSPSHPSSSQTAMAGLSQSPRSPPPSIISTDVDESEKPHLKPFIIPSGKGSDNTTKRRQTALCPTIRGPFPRKWFRCCKGAMLGWNAALENFKEGLSPGHIFDSGSLVKYLKEADRDDAWTKRASLTMVFEIRKIHKEQLKGLTLAYPDGTETPALEYVDKELVRMGKAITTGLNRHKTGLWFDWDEIPQYI